MTSMPDDLLERRLRETAPVHHGAVLPDLTDAAAAAGLLDVAYATLDSPVGTLLLAATPAGLVRVAYLDGEDAEATVLGQLAARVSPGVRLHA